MELETTSPRSPNTVYRPAIALPATVPPAPIEAEVMRPALEYGCVDWYAYASASELPMAAIG